MKHKNKKTAFSLIELLVVISSISLLMAVMIPALGRAKKQGKAACCLSNLRQMAIAADIYTQSEDGYFPLAFAPIKMDPQTAKTVEACWDFTIEKIWTAAEPVTDLKPGILWQHESVNKIHQCPAFKGRSNTSDDPYTGYNYNTSYIGYDERSNPPTSAKAAQLRSPQNTALFGDGEVVLQNVRGANKFMRAPWANPRDESFSGRYAGTQGFRHLEKTNVAFADLHAQSLSKCYTETYEQDQKLIGKNTGFLSKDNSLYDLE